MEAGDSFEWSDLFDFTIDDQLLLSNLDDPFPAPQVEELPPVQPVTVAPEPGNSGERVRKRDPRMVCENFLAGLVPCACPELDAKMEEEEEEAGPGKKRVRVVGRTPGSARCQVPGCGVDISELKGYHKRHRVCLGCANAAMVEIEGESKRYCQQCGKFHLLLDFDEGKRSCRRKLERHNNRRRRKPTDSKGAVERDLQGDLRADVSSDGEVGKDNTSSSSQFAEKEDSKDGTLSNLCPAPESQINESDSLMRITQVDKVLENWKLDHSPPSSDNKSAYSSVSPTGRISFKLYDWNPAEFPRRLRHQIFQWLSSMPVELEGYIRPGCTILTAFVSMPQIMWVKLFEDPVSFVKNSLQPGGMLCGRGTALVYLNDTIFRILRDGASVLQVQVAMRAPKLNYVYPPCFEAGKPMDLIACGTNLLQPKFRSLISFAGSYLSHDYYVAFPQGSINSESGVDFDRQFCRIYVPCTEPGFFGPAFIEVENECGLSNFVPVLIGDEHVCSEIKLIHQNFDCCSCKKDSQLRSSCSLLKACEVSCSRQTAFSEFLLDVAWLLKWPHSEKFHGVMNSLQIQRFNCLLKFLISNKSTSILDRILLSLQVVLDDIESNDVSTVTDSDWRLFKEYTACAKDLLHQETPKYELMSQHVLNPVTKSNVLFESSYDEKIMVVDCTSSKVVEMRADMKTRYLDDSDSSVKSEDMSLLNGEFAMNINENRDWRRTSCSLTSSRRFMNSRPYIYMIAALALCCGICAVIFHPHKVSKFAVTIRRCILDDSSKLT